MVNTNKIKAYRLRQKYKAVAEEGNWHIYGENHKKHKEKDGKKLNSMLKVTRSVFSFDFL